MNLHPVIDHLAIRLGAIVMARSKYFRDGIDTPSFDHHLKSVEFDMPEVSGECDYELVARTLVGDVPAAFRVAQWKGEGWPTIVYHHGAGDIPFDSSFKRLFPYEEQPIHANLIAVRAPWHRSFKDFRKGISTLGNWAAMMAVSVRLIEEIVSFARTSGAAPVLVTGTSLGGFITNRHRAHYNSADVYVPMLAGAAMGDLFVNSVYRKGVAGQARQNPKAVKAAMDFEEEYARVSDSNVYPVLARYDQIVLFDRQKRCYGDRPIMVLNKGHITGAMSHELLRQHILERISRQAPVQ